jgi:hypothetical protein
MHYFDIRTMNRVSSSETKLLTRPSALLLHQAMAPFGFSLETAVDSIFARDSSRSEFPADGLPIPCSVCLFYKSDLPLDFTAFFGPWAAIGDGREDFETVSGHEFLNNCTFRGISLSSGFTIESVHPCSRISIGDMSPLRKVSQMESIHCFVSPPGNRQLSRPTPVRMVAPFASEANLSTFGGRFCQVAAVIFQHCPCCRLSLILIKSVAFSCHCDRRRMIPIPFLFANAIVPSLNARLAPGDLPVPIPVRSIGLKDHHDFSSISGRFMSVSFVVLSLFLFASMTRCLNVIDEFMERLKKAGEETRKGDVLCIFELNRCLTLMAAGFLRLSRVLKQSNDPSSLAYYDPVSMIIGEFVVLSLCPSTKCLPAPVIAIDVVEALKNDCGKCLRLELASEVARVWLRQLLVPSRAHVAQGKATFDLFRLRGGSNDGFEIADSRSVC